ncbi:helix-turn-helix transcriptional regulator [uncultured Streptomyces sp.]|uniref:helix-turn-helix domain-containing protein n=1 Tax=uncultured Streptomyces sp. TaxID=174707 RepID=UPI002619EAA1|nr:helix-turn-helix transcriptional regulator [uncultured Streptomyces sp.]
MTDGTVGTTGAGGGGEPESADSLKVFGEVVKVFRKRAGLTQEQLAPSVRYSVPTIASIEQGRRFPPPAFIDRAEEVLDAFGTIRAAAKHLGRRPGLANWFRQLAQLETEAITMYTYECRTVPGLLQTAAYTRALGYSVPPLPSAELIEQRVANRMARAELLSVQRVPAADFSFIMEQAVLERRTGGEETTRELLDHVVRVVDEHPNVELQIMPLRQPVHSGIDGPFQLLEMPDHRWFSYTENQNTGHLDAAPKTISYLQQRYARMRSQALTSADSLALLKHMRGAL